MLKKYNIAFIPKHNSEQFIQHAQQLALNAAASSYLLGERSLPHISLCHFEMDDSQIENLWGLINNLNSPTLILTFKHQRSKSYGTHPKWGGVCWVSLLPDNLATLHKIHWLVAAIIRDPLNASFLDYDPHLTLLNSRAEAEYELLNTNSAINPPFVDEFIIALGLIDEVGQITEILYA